jgi:hypothetical protein
MAPPELESSADDYLSSHDESSGLKLLFVQPVVSVVRGNSPPLVDSLTRATKLIK